MFPIGDENLPGRGLAWITLGLIAVNVAVFFLLQGATAGTHSPTAGARSRTRSTGVA
jgi:hypothetical protein